MDRRPVLSVCLPALDEAPRLEPLVDALPERVGAVVESFEAVVVDDGSTDETPVVLDRLARHHAWLRAIRHPERRGYGAAARAALDAARGESLLLCDADGQFDLSDLGALFEHRDQHDLVVGTRLRRADGPLRVLSGRLWTRATNVLLGRLASDVNCGFKLTSRAAWERVTSELSSEGAAFSAEWLLCARRAGLRVKEVPVRHAPREGGRATGLEPRVVLRGVADLLRLRRRS